MHYEKIIPIILMLAASFICCCIGWNIGGRYYDAGNAGAVIGFVLPTLIMYWLSKIKTPEDKGRT